ncbi:MAG: hypothetical protein INR67_15565 [Jatrophihabitans endophyticus]|nr:hypothetical protein [Jatrophihabitans endophyticus]
MEPTPGAREVTVATARLERWIRGFFERHGFERHGGERHAGERRGGDVAGAADARTVLLTGDDGARAWIDVPFPPLAAGADLVAHATAPRTVGVLLVRRGGHAAGVFEGASLVASKVGSSYVQGTTKAGGWSQQRYARRRANQANAAFADAADDAARVLVGPGLHGRELAGLVTGGDRPAVQAVLDDRRLAALKPLVTGPWLQVKDPKLRVLSATPDQFLVVRIRLDP